LTFVFPAKGARASVRSVWTSLLTRPNFFRTITRGVSVRAAPMPSLILTSGRDSLPTFPPWRTWLPSFRCCVILPSSSPECRSSAAFRRLPRKHFALGLRDDNRVIVILLQFFSGPILLTTTFILAPLRPRWTFSKRLDSV